jgi:diguanylate cyclase (GGDEF)-like protein
MRFLAIPASRIRVARLFLTIGAVFGIIATFSSIHMGMHGEAMGGIAAVIATPIILWLSRQPRFRYLPNFAALLISMGFSIGSAFTMLEHSAGLVWMGVTPIMYFYLSNRHLGIALAVLTVVCFVVSYLIYPTMHGVEPISIGEFGQAMSVFLYSTLLAWLYESEWTGKYDRLKMDLDRDFLTEIFNRRAIVRHMEMSISNNRRKKSPLSVLLFDLDNFKSVNDTHGHDVGDEVLKELVDTVKSNIRRGDVFGRWGGEEFIIVCNQSLEECKLFAEKLRVSISKHKFEHIKHLTASFGAVQYSDGESVGELISRVDNYLYDAKKSKNCVVVENAA